MTPLEHVETNYHAVPTGSLSLAAALRSYRDSLPAGVTISRAAFVAAVGEHYPIGLDSFGVYAIGGLSETPPKSWAVDSDGRLRLRLSA